MGKGSSSSSSSDSGGKQWAKKYLLDPLTEPEPNQLDGPGSSFANPKRSLSVHVNRQQYASKRTSQDRSLPSPPQSASPSRGSFHPSNPFSDHNSTGQRPASNTNNEWAPASSILTRTLSNESSHQSGPRSPERDWRHNGGNLGRSNTTRAPRYSQGSQGYGDGSGGLNRSSSAATGGMQRRGSLSQRYQGDMSHRPLDMLKRDHRAADRAPHNRARRQHPDVDVIDGLDTSGPYGLLKHHGGPYDATLASRNTNPMYSPVEAVRASNEEALRATPHHFVKDSLMQHVPLQGVASVPPGHVSGEGQRMHYREGADLMREEDAAGGPYKRWDGIPYHPDDLKGKGEPSFSVDRATKNYDVLSNRRAEVSLGASGVNDIEMTTPRRSSTQRSMTPRSGGVAERVNNKGSDQSTTLRVRSISDASSMAGPSGSGMVSPPAETAITSGRDIGGADLKRRNTTGGNRFGESLKRKFASLRRKKINTDA